MLKITKVEDKKSLKTFIDLPHTLYKGDPNYVPELYVSQEELLNPKKHPFHKHSKVELFLAIKDDKVVGRIAAIEIIIIINSITPQMLSSDFLKQLSETLSEIKVI